MRILLVQPAPFEERRLGLENTVWRSEPVSLTSIAAMVPDHEVRILDMRCEKPSVLPEVLSGWQPDIVGTTAMTTDAYQAQAVLRLAKQIVPGALTLIGGHHCTLNTASYYVDWVDAAVLGEGELVFKEIVERWGRERSTRALEGLQGTDVRLPDGTRSKNGKAKNAPNLDHLPAPARHLVEQYRGQYFFLAAKPMASIFTSRGCSFDCNFCAIWEFYDRRTRFLSAEVIADRMAACEEPFIFLLDDNFMTRADRLEKLASELERRKIKKFFMTQGRSDFIAEHPELIARLARVGLMGVLSGYETNDEKALEGLRKRNTLDNNIKAAKILKDNGVISTGIFMVRPEFDRDDFAGLFEYIESLGVAIPLVTILTPLPGTEMWKKYREDLLTEDFRLFDLLHAVTSTKLPREEFYKEYVAWKRVGRTSMKAWFNRKTMLKRWDFYLRAAPNFPEMIWKRVRYQRIQFDPQSYLRDEVGIIRSNHSPRRPVDEVSLASK
ncbi:MAG: cobalamin-dependent protein [Deltaproteobacteria bacterium]|nr:cobalamin-dependent protein [Deltaproteobacteria bacterium]